MSRTRGRAAAALAPVALLALPALLAAGGCTVGPEYHRPALELPTHWQLEAPWREGRPADGQDKGPWWRRYGDAPLDALQQRAQDNSPTLAIAQARLAQARASLAGAEAARSPQLALGSRAARFKISANRPLTNYNNANASTVQDDYQLSLTASYEIDFAGRVRRSVEAANASAEQSAADLANIGLLVSADLATAYFNLRATDAELDVVQRSIAVQRRALELVSSRHELGAVSGLDVAQQDALLASTLTQVDLLRKQRGQYEHAIATLTGTPAPAFTLAPALAPIVVPEVPVGLPSDLLERRPDVAAAERAMAAANAQIGVAAAAYYPNVVLAPSVGVDSRILDQLFDAPSLLWSIGVSATQPLIDGGRIRANVDFSRAGHEASVAAYRRTVLTAMQEVEDGIGGLAALERAAGQSDRAVQAARRVLGMATDRYEGGASAYLDVISAQQSLLNVERQAAQLQGQRLVTSVFLIKALGGDWCGLPDTVAPAAGASASMPLRTGCPAPAPLAAGSR